MRELSIYSGDSGAISEQDFIAVYTDTVTDPNYVIDDPFDNSPHIPLNIKVTQKSHAWSNPEADDGENFHTDCEAFTNLFDPYSPQEFADQLNFDEFVTNALQAKWLYDIPGYDTDSDGYAGKYYLCGVEPDQDTIYYEGDGVPDLKVPHISPYRKSLRLTLENDVDVRVRWNGLVPETRIDYTLSVNDFEGYKISHSVPGPILYAQVAGYDREDYLKVIWSSAHQQWDFLPNVLTAAEILSLYGVADVSQYSMPDTALAFHWLDSVFYFAPACENNSDLSDSLMIHKLYPMQPYPSTFNVDSLYALYPDELTDEGFLKYFECDARHL